MPDCENMWHVFVVFSAYLPVEKTEEYHAAFYAVVGIAVTVYLSVRILFLPP